MTNYYLHFIGRHLYDIKPFIIESKKIGVQRAVPYNILKGMKWGDIVFLAIFQKDEKVKERIGIAKIFAYFKIHGLSTTMPKEGFDEFYNCFESSTNVDRICGSYTVTSTCIIEEEIEEMLKRLEEKRLNPMKYKWFIRGAIHLLKQPIILQKVKFFRGYKKLKKEEYEKLLKEIKKEKLEQKDLKTLSNYKQRFYITKKEKVKKLCKSLYDFLEGGV